jgi:hypothetical protein
MRKICTPNITVVSLPAFTKGNGAIAIVSGVEGGPFPQSLDAETVSCTLPEKPAFQLIFTVFNEGESTPADDGEIVQLYPFAPAIGSVV